MKYLLIGFLFVSTPLMAAEKPVTNFAWTNPTTFESGSPANPGDLAAVRLKCGPAAGSYTIEYRYTENVTLGAAVKMPIANVITTDGAWYCAAASESVDGTVGPNSPATEKIVALGGVFTVARDGLAVPSGLRVQ